MQINGYGVNKQLVGPDPQSYVTPRNYFIEAAKKEAKISLSLLDGSGVKMPL